MFIKRRLKCISIFLLFVIALNIFLTSCTPEKHDTGDDTITVTDALERKVCIKKKPMRVAALLGSLADVFSLAGGTLCAAPEDAFTDFGLDLPGAINIGGAHSPSLELVLASDPELVLASASTASNIEMKDALEAAGITVVFFDVDNFEDYLLMLNVCTDITGRKDLYDKNGLQIKAQIEEIKSKFKNKNISDSEKHILLLRASSTSLKAKGSSGTILGEMLSDMGLINIADSEKSLLENLTAEAVIREEPYRIFAVTMGSDTEAAKRSLENTLYENPAFASLPAVKENRVHVMDKTLFNLKPNDRWAEAYGVLYEILTKK